MTSLDDRQAMIEGLAEGADDYISKSSDFDVLRARVRAQIRRRQFEDENRRFHEKILRLEMETAEERAARALAETRAALVEELERANRDLEAFSYSISHDLRSPLRAIQGYGRILAEDFGETLPEEALRSVRRMCDGAERMGLLIDALLQFSRLGRKALRKQRVSLPELVSEALEEIGVEGRLDGVQLSVDALGECFADPLLLKQVFVNLLSNAAKFSRGRTPAIVAVGRALGPNGEEFFVRDNGVGFNPEYSEKLFAVFKRLHRESEFEGTGVGLALVKRIVERHGGTVRAESEVGKGATFYFSLGSGVAENGASAAGRDGTVP